MVLRILTSKEMRQRAGNISRYTEWRLHQRREGPPRVHLDGRSWGYPEHLFEQWLMSRLERPLEFEKATPFHGHSEHPKQHRKRAKEPAAVIAPRSRKIAQRRSHKRIVAESAEA